MTARSIFAVLRFCPYLKVTTKVYKGSEWIKHDSGVIGFVCNVKSNINKSGQLEKVRDYCKAANLPVIIEDQMTFATQFKIVIVKP